MSLKEKLEINDIVHVDINNAQMTLCHKARLLRIPAATGDSWIFRNMQTGQLHYVSEGCTVSSLKKEDA